MTDAGPTTPAEPEGGPDAPFREAIDAAPVMIWVSDTNRLCNWFSRNWLAFTGRTMEQEVGNGWSEGVHPEDLDHRLASYVMNFDARQPFRMQYRLRRYDGVYRWIDDTGIPRYADDGTFLGYIGSCTDIHDHKETESQLRQLQAALQRRIGETTTRLASEVAAHQQTEQELAQSAAQLSLLLGSIKDYAIYMVDHEGRVVSWNSGAERIKGYTAGEIIGQHFSRFYMEEDRRNGVPKTTLARAASEGRFEAEGWRIRKDGSRFWAHVVVDPIHDRDGALIGYAKVTRDVTERRQAQDLFNEARERMAQVQKMEAIGQLTGGVAHDFNNLLMVIAGNLEIAQRVAKSPEGSEARLARTIDNAIQGARRAATLTQRLLAFSRRQALDPKPLELNKFIAAEVEFLQRTLGETIEVVAVGGAGLWKVEIDSNQLEAALLNLAVNARDAMPSGGTLTIETSNAFLDEDYCRRHPEVQRGQYVLLSVTDNGAGMTEEVMTRAFEPFFSTKAIGHGTGLGLSQVYGFIKQSGGHVKIYSELGEGTTIKVYLPRLVGDVPVDQDERTGEPVSGEPGETIMVVEDDEGVRAYLVEVLRDLKYRVMRASDSESALTLMEQSRERIDLLLTDVVLPGMNGRELARRAQAARPDLKVLFMTGYSRNAVVHQGRLDPGVELMQKPVTQEHLAARIRMVLDAKPRRRDR